MCSKVQADPLLIYNTIITTVQINITLNAYFIWYEPY